MVLAGDLVLNKRTQHSLDFVKKNMTFIDINNDADDSLYTDPLTKKGTRITDRKKLAQFINELDSSPEFHGILVIDVAFDIPTEDDTLLKSAVLNFITNHKLVLASSSRYPPVPLLTFGDSLYGDVTDKLYSKKCFNHELIKENGNVSLPFKVYAQLKDVQSYSRPIIPLTGLRKMHTGDSSPFFIDHLIEYNSIPYDSLDISDNSPQFDEMSITGINHTATASPIKVYDLGAVIGDDRELFQYDEQIKAGNGSYNIVMVGSFNKQGRDSHTTFQSDVLQGSLILSSLIENLLNTRAMNVTRFWFLLFICFSVITFMVTCVSLKKESAQSNEKGFKNFLWKVFKIVFLNEIHFWLLFATLVIILNYSGRIMNIISLYMFFVVMELIFKSFGKSSDNEITSSSK